MSIYLISNREVINGKFRDDGKDKALGSSFRIAVCAEDAAKKTMHYEIIPDTDTTGYENVIKALAKQIEPAELKGSELMFFDLYNQMLESKNQRSDVLFFIHGFSTSFSDSLEHMYKLKKLYMQGDSPIKHLVYLSWPTRDSKLLTYWNDQEDSRSTGFMLSRVFIKLHGLFSELFEIHRQQRCGNKIHIAAHSMGNQVLKHMLISLPKDKLVPLFGEILLLHSDVEDNVFEPGEPFTLLEFIGERTHIYINRSDDALRISRTTKNFNKRLGQKGPSNRAVLNSETFIADTSEINDVKNKKDTVIDHWHYLYSPTVTKDIIEVLKGNDEDNIKTHIPWEKEKQYFIINETEA